MDNTLVCEIRNTVSTTVGGTKQCRLVKASIKLLYGKHVISPHITSRLGRSAPNINKNLARQLYYYP